VQSARPSGALGTPLVRDAFGRHVGVDVKYTPNADNTLDGTIRPDFSQIESDTAQISANQRFALFFQEKRPFFLEGVELLSTPIQAVYTRTITAPDAGGRATGTLGGVNYTALVANDAGGGSVVVPGPTASSLAAQDFHAAVFVGRARRDFNGTSFVSLLMTNRENGSNGHNRLVGPDAQIRFLGTETISGQYLFSDTTTPNRPDVNSTWTGQHLRSGAAQIGWGHSTARFDVSGTYKDFGSGFRADNGFVPQVGYRAGDAEAGWTFRPKGLVSRVRTFVSLEKQTERDTGRAIYDKAASAVGMDTKWSGFLQLRWEHTHVRAGDQLFGRNQLVYFGRFSPSRRIQQIEADGFFGQEADFENPRLGRGGSVNVSSTVIASKHLVFDLIANTTWLHVPDRGVRVPLFTARVSRLRANYTFTARSFVRAIGQYVSTDRDPSLFLSPQASRDGTFSGSILFAYKLNWQSVMFFGYGDERTLDERHTLQRADRSVFVKLSYAFQR
jgi:hypothetical protein